MGNPSAYHFANLSAKVTMELCNQATVWMEFFSVKANLWSRRSPAPPNESRISPGCGLVHSTKCEKAQSSSSY